MQQLQKNARFGRGNKTPGEDALVLLALLNGVSGSYGPSEPILFILTTLQQVEIIRNSHSDRDKVLHREIVKRVNEVNGALTNFPMYPQVNSMASNSYYLSVKDPCWGGPDDTAEDYREADEVLAVHLILEELRNGRLDHYRRCESCDQWLKKETSHQKYCSDACRVRNASKSDVFKRKRREYMKSYRIEEKERERKALAAAKRSKKGKS